MQHPSAPRVTFIVPCFNETPAVLTASLSSVAGQDFTDFECLVIDESNNVDSVAACQAFCTSHKRFRRIVPAKRIGLAASLNLGLAEARGEYIARFDSDDVCLPHRLTLQVAKMDARPDIGVLGGGLEIMDIDGQSLAFRSYPTEHDRIAQRLHLTTPIAHPTAIMRRAVVEAAGGYDPAFRFAEDLDLWLRLLNAGVRFANLPQTLVRYRQQETRRNPNHWRYNLRARRKNFAPSYLFRRLVGMGAIGLWIYMPPRLQERIFRTLILAPTSIAKSQ
jgi:glycosyltransferase involved in cell wall biosynthesis